MCVSVLPRNLGDSFISLLVEPIAGKNVSLSDKQLWLFSKNVLGAEKSQCKALSIGRHLEIYSLLLMSAENTKTLLYLWSFVFWALSIVISSCSSAIYGVLFINLQVQVQSDGKLMRKECPHVCWILIDLLAEFCLCWGVCIQSNIFVGRVLHFRAFI